MPLVHLLIIAFLTVSASPAPGQQASPIQEVTASPEATADAYLRSVRAIRWGTTAQLVHPETLARFRFTVTVISDADAGGELRAYLAQTDSTGLASLTDAEVFDRAVGAVIDDMPGLMHALYDRTDDVIGAIEEDATTAHAVYRTTARISGAVPEIKVIQLARTPDGWRVLWSDELEVIQAALNGVGRQGPL